ncbi:Distal membrane-arm assembly complex protein 1 [Lemmus lemmus]
MGSSLSQHIEYAKPPPAIPPAKTAAPTSVVPDSSSKNCWSCRLLSGSALLGAGVYVYLLGQRPLKRGLPVQPGTVAQMALGVCIACFGVVVLVDPKKSSHQV